MTNAELNNLLADAKKAQQYWDRWKREGTFDGSPLVEVLSKSVEECWETLHKALRESVPCKLSLESGEIVYFATVGILMDDLWMHYGVNTADRKFLIEEVHLESIASIEKVEESPK